MNPSEINAIVNDDNEDFETERREEIIDQRRWVTVNSKIVHQKSTGKIFEIIFETPSTEQQEGSEGDPIMYEVRKEEYTAIRYVKV